MRSPLLSVSGTLCKRFKAAFSTERLRTFGNGRKLFRFSKKRVRITETRAKHRFWQEISTSFFKVRRSLGKGGRQPSRSVRHKNFFCLTILLSLRIFPVFSTPRTAFTTARTVNEAVAAAFHVLFLFTAQRPQTAISLPLLR